jgi:putative ABC transport system permease protein
VVVQFAILIGLSIATAAIYAQMQFGTREALRALGSPVLVIDTPCLDALKNELAQIPAVAGAACAWQLPQLGIGPGTSGRWGDREPTGLSYPAVDFGLLELYGVELAAGRSFDAARGDAVALENTWTVPERIVINETAARNLGLASADDAIGKIITWNRVFALPATFTGAHDAEIIGVVKDFQIGSVRDPVRPAAFFLDTKLATLMSVKIVADDLPAALEAVDAAWRRAGEPRPIQRYFYSDAVERMYVDVVRQVTLFTTFASVAIFIAVLGLVGLVAFVAERRTKEIGIRKTLGGTRAGVVRLLLWQFSKPVLIANVIAWPAAFVAMRRWLGGFARHVDLDSSWFFGAAAAALALALATVFIHAYRTAGIHPVDALRAE